MKVLQATIEYNAESTLGEGPVWDAAIQKLYWVDIKAMMVYRYDPNTKTQESWKMDQMVGCIVPVDNDAIVCALQDRLITLNTNSGKQSSLIAIEADLPENRCNDGKADAEGRFWIGSLNIPGKKSKANLYSVDKNLNVIKAVSDLGMSNGLGWSRDYKLMYLNDTVEKQVLKFDFSLTDGKLSNRQILLDLKDADGSPDGMCVDADGNLWIAFYGGKRVDCYDPVSRQILATVQVPAINVTCCTFGGPALDTLFITTARDGQSDEDLKNFPGSGSIFRVKPGVKGMATNRFRRGVTLQFPE